MQRLTSFEKKALQRSELDSISKGFFLQHAVLFHRTYGFLRVYVPKQHGLPCELIRELHDLPIAGHFGWKKTYHALAQHNYWGDKVEDSTSSLPVRCPSTTSETFQLKYIGPFTVLDVQGKVLRLQMPRAYSQVHDKFNVEQVRPWLHSGDNEVNPEFPEIAPHLSLGPVLVLDRRRLVGRLRVSPPNLTFQRNTWRCRRMDL
jgi:hypothetical protein